MKVYKLNSIVTDDCLARVLLKIGFYNTQILTNYN
jgi:hypothetical protein